MNHFYFIGIGGVGMSALAHCLLDQQCCVEGSDTSMNQYTKSLVAKGARISEEQEAVIPDGATVVYSSGIPQHHPLLAEVAAKKLPLLHRSDLLKILSARYDSIAVAGTHGKTTVSSLLTYLLDQGGYQPSYALGGVYAHDTGRIGKGKYFVFEADESDGSLVKYAPFGAIITNIDFDHMEFYGTKEKVLEVFRAFIGRVASTEHLIYCGDDPYLKSLVTAGISYGFGEGHDAQILSYHQKEWESVFTLQWQGTLYHFTYPFPGKHQALNVTAAWLAAVRLGMDPKEAQDTVTSFPGVHRRLEKKFTFQSILCVDDYAHHPTEVLAGIRAMKEAFPYQRLVLVFQPHRYSRLHCYFQDFVEVLRSCDVVWLTEVFTCKESSFGVDTYDLYQALLAHSSSVYYAPYEQLAAQVAAHLQPHDRVVTMGAGSITNIGPALLEQLQQKGLRKVRVALLCGGNSPEHPISMISARYVENNLDPTLYDVTRFEITPQGRWEGSDGDHLLSSAVFERLMESDFVFPIFHGPYGEDGTIQGFLEILQKPYAGSTVLPAAVTNHKLLTKYCAQHCGIPVLPSLYCTLDRYRADPEAYHRGVKTYPVFVKPCKIGSSLGMSYVKRQEELPAALERAFRYDYEVLIEEAIEKPRELDFCVLGNHGCRIDVLEPGEVLTEGAFYDYEKKYGEHPAPSTLHVDLPREIIERGKDYARRLCEMLYNTGIMRVDFLLDQANTLWLLEMNPIPGLRPASIFPNAWATQGGSHQSLLDHLFILGMHQERRKRILRQQ